MKNEKREENCFVAKVEANGGDAIKLAMPGPYGRRGRNDRLVLMVPRFVALFEFKADDEEPTRIQLYMHRKYRKMGIPCHVVYTCEEAWEILEKERRRHVRAMEIPVGVHKIRHR